MSDKRKDVITEDTKVPLRIFWGFAVVAVLVIGSWYDMRSRLDGTVTEKQVQRWIDDAREQNQGNGVKFPRLPEKNAGPIKIEETDVPVAMATAPH